MSQTNGQHDDFLQNGPNNSFQISQPSMASMSNNSSSSNDPPTEFPVPTGPPISDFLSQLSDYNTTIPDTVTSHYLASAGLETTDPRIVKLVSLAAQKFVSDVAADALTHCKMRQNSMSNMNKKQGKDRKFVMTTEDLSQALGEQGVSVKKPPYYQ